MLISCKECGSKKFINREFNWIWTEEIVDIESESVMLKSKEVDLREAGGGWDGFFCAECDEPVDDDDDENYERSEILSNMYDAWKTKP
jgi:hypothetical protein